MNYKVKSDRTIEKLSNLLTTANSKISDQQREIKYYIIKIREFLKKFSTQLSQNVQEELELILTNRKNIGSASPTETKFKTMQPQNDYDANLQL